MNPPPRVRPSPGQLATAVASAALALAGVAMLPLLEQAEPGSVGTLAAPGSFGWWTIVAVILVQSLALVAVARFPRTLLVVVAAAPVAVVVFAPGPAFSLGTVGMLVAVFLAAVHHPLRRLGTALGAAGVLVAGAQTANDLRSGQPLSAAGVATAVLQAIVVVGIPLVIALMISARREARAARDSEVQALRREHAALLQAAVSRERTAMSRELHDTAAHHMSGIALMAAAMDRQIDTDPAAAKSAARQVRAQSTAVLDDLRRIVGLLRDDAEGTRSVETLAAIRELVEERQTAGMTVRLQVLEPAVPAGLGDGVGPLAQLVIYRMVQESLANAATHAPRAHCLVEIDDRDPDRLGARVDNDAFHDPDPGPGGGFGLLGLRERAELVGAELHYGVTDRGGWEVSISVPRDDMARRRPGPSANPQEIP